MANPSKAKGTYRETWSVAQATERGLPARRAETNQPARDVDVQADRLRIHEVKDRQNLNVHKTLKASQVRYDAPCAVIWHRTSRKGDNTRLSPDGPTIAALPVDDYLDLLAVARAAQAVRDYADDSLDFVMDTLDEALTRIDRKYPRESEVAF